ncbi:MAG: UDP-3-O-(3-hydroxymyristoyl)glucosamine N-acyltransferase [Phycisphaera sp.]|nr:UDP-3-O-(3-hydroxymyristoyl)glucosamine N-acyltransferase [Phycisphaera sp.]
MTWTTQQIAELTGGQLRGPGDVSVGGIDTLETAAPNQLTFIGDAKYARKWPQSKAVAALVARKVEMPQDGARPIIAVDNVDIAVAKVLEAMAPPPTQPEPGVHPTAFVDPSATLGDDVRIGPHVVVGPNVTIGDRAVLHPNVTVLADSAVGADSVMWPGVVIRERCTIGQRCIFHPNVTIGADGFGYRPDPGGRGIVKIPQIGTVEIGNDVELGAGSCVDRGKFGPTVVGDMCKVDNLVQIAHNCRVGRCVIIAGKAGLAGSVTVGDGVVIGGGALLKDHITVGDGATIAGQAAVMTDVPSGGTWVGYPAKDARIAGREYAAIAKLPDVLKQMKKILREDR